MEPNSGKKRWGSIREKPHQVKMIPQFYQIHLQQQLKETEYLTLKLLVYLLQCHKTVSIESLATLMPYPIKFESRRRNIQRFLNLESLKIETLWFPLIEIILKEKFKPEHPLKLAIDRTQWRDKNVFMISLIWDKRAIPLYWQLLDKRGSSNLEEQQALITPILELLKDYEIIILGDREFGSVKLGQWLCQQQVKFVLRIKQERYIQSDGEDYTRLSELGLLPGTRFYLRGVKVTKQKGFGSFNIAAYWKRKYRGKAETEGWYLLTNLEDLQQSITAFKCRSGIEAMFKDCKSGGYNLEKTQASEYRLNNLILLIALAYSCAILQGQQIKRKGIQNYVGRLKEFRRSLRRHSSFWMGLYGQSWVIGMEFFQEIVNELMLLRRNKLPFFQRGLRAMSLILSTF
jgi:Transposase DDE domain